MTALGISLLVVGVVVVLVEAHFPALGMLGGPGVVAMSAGAILAVAGLGGGVILGVLMGLVLGAAGVGLLTVSLRKGFAARHRRIRAGPEGLIGHVGVVRSWSEPTGRVLVDGALWRARRTPYDEQPELHEGDPVVVERLTGLTLSVRRAEDWELVA